MGYRTLGLSLLALLTGAYAQPCMLITPNVLRVDSMETIVVDGHGMPFDADIEIHDHPQKLRQLAQVKLSVNRENQYLGTANVMIPSKALSGDSNQYVSVAVKSKTCSLEKVVLLGYQSGYIFIQTDKSIYTPESKVLYRIYAMDSKMAPANKPVIVTLRNAENNIVQQVNSQPEKNIHSGSFQLPKLASGPGLWTISAKYEDSPLHNYTTYFEVKEYVLPSYEIQLTANKNFFHINDKEFPVTVKAVYPFSKHVDGTAFVIFGRMKDGVKKSFPSTLKKIQIEDGEGTAVLRREDFINDLKNVTDITLYMSTTMISDSGSEIVKAEMKNIPIVTSPYEIKFVKTSKYFKPGFPFTILVSVTHPDGSPASWVPVSIPSQGIKARTDSQGITRMTVNTIPEESNIPITVTTADPTLPDDQQSSETMTATAFNSNGNDLHISIPNAEVKPGDTLPLNFVFKNSDSRVKDTIKDFTYMIMNKGSIVKVKRERIPKEGVSSVTLPITTEFIPSFRIVAYYHVGPMNEIVSDSKQVDVTDNCMDMLKVESKRSWVNFPGDPVTLKVSSNHKASVALVATAKSLHGKNKKFMISQKKVRDLVDRSDNGCTPDGGGDGDSMGVFYGAGLAAMTNTKKETKLKSELGCESKNRKRRSDDDEFLDEEDILQRSFLPESWMLQVLDLNKQPDNKGISSEDVTVYLPDSLTTWEVQAVSVSEKGICFSQPYEIATQKNFFIDLRLPYSVVRNEQVEIRAVLFNYGDRQTEAQVSLYYNPDFCSLADSKSHYKQTVTVQPKSSVTVPFIIVPLVLGDIDVKALASSAIHGVADGIKKKIKVVDSDVSADFLNPGNQFDLPVTAEQESRGINVSQPFKSTTKKQFFIDLRLPYSVLRNEQVELRVIIFNYGNRQTEAQVSLPDNPGFRSLADSTLENKRSVTIPPRSSATVNFIIIPLVLGDIDVKARASSAIHGVADEITKKIKVMDSGISAHTLNQGYQFDLSVTAKPEPLAKRAGNVRQTVSITICTRYLGDGDAPMSMLDVTMLPGFQPELDDLEKLKNQSPGEFEFNRKAAKKGNLHIYLNQVSKIQKCLTFHAHQINEQGLLQPASVTLLDVRNPENRCTKFYHLNNQEKLIPTFCQAGICQCLDRTCSKTILEIESIDASTRFDLACAAGMDYAYKVSVTEAQLSDTSDTYIMTIQWVIKPGTDTNIKIGEKRSFISHNACRASLDLKIGRSYVVWGPFTSLLEDKEGNVTYLIGEDTWMEWWPSDRECLEPQHNDRCKDLFQFSQELHIDGCQH